MLFSIQLIIILVCLFYGARKGGIALGLLGGIGLVILVFVFHLQPGKPPVDVMLVITRFAVWRPAYAGENARPGRVVLPGAAGDRALPVEGGALHPASLRRERRTFRCDADLYFAPK